MDTLLSGVEDSQGQVNYEGTCTPLPNEGKGALIRIRAMLLAWTPPFSFVPQARLLAQPNQLQILTYYALMQTKFVIQK